MRVLPSLVSPASPATFDASEFNLLTGNFANPKVGWNIDLVGTDLVLNAVFVPEPSSTPLY